MRLFRTANIVDPPDGAPPRRHAFSDTTNSVSGVTRPFAISSNRTMAVINFAMLAGAMDSSAARSNRTAPVSLSMTIACGAAVSNRCACAPATVKAMAIAIAKTGWIKRNMVSVSWDARQTVPDNQQNTARPWLHRPAIAMPDRWQSANNLEWLKGLRLQLRPGV